MIIFEILKVSLQNIWINKMRSSLTMLGLIIGISAVVVITTLGNAAKADMAGAFGEQSKGRMQISVQSKDGEYPQYRDYFSDEDVTAISDLEDTEAASGLISYWVDAKHKNNNIMLDVYGVNSEYEKVENVSLLNGRFLSEEDIKGRRNVIIIDENAANHLFGTVDCLGEVVTLIGGQEFMVIGVLKLSDSTIMKMAMGTYYQGYMPITVATRLFSFDRYPQVMIQAKEILNTQQVGERILSFLGRINKDEEMYRVYTLENELSQVNSSLGFLTGTISGIAGISLVVGGIGIMNIMLVSVTERTREIGVRKALGAKPTIILLQFLFEAVILSVLGGLIGLALGGGVGLLAVKVLNLPFIVSTNAIMLAFIFSLLVGVFFGVYPAKKASKLDPIEALRYE